MVIRKETVKVKGEDDVVIEVRVTNSGPLLDIWGAAASAVNPYFPRNYSENNRFSFNFALFHVPDTTPIAMQQWHYATSVHELRKISYKLTNPMLSVLSIDD